MVVTGSDIKESRYTKQLKSYGIPVAIGQAAENVPEGDDVTVVISTAILDNNPELEEARRRNLNVIHRAQMLARGRAARHARGSGHAWQDHHVLHAREHA